MFGAIIGDLAGSIYEYEQIKKVKPIKMKNLIEDNAFFSDDTILTISNIDSILNKLDYGENYKKYVKKYINFKPNVIPYFETHFSPSFVKWTNFNSVGTSCGNGCLMRISPIGFLFNTEKDVIANAILATIPSHNSEESINGAILIALLIFYARKGYKKDEIIKKLKLKIKKPKITKFNYTVKETLPICLYSIFKTNNFNDAIKLSLSFGGDTDTNACIVGSVAEAFYGVDENIKEKALTFLPTSFKTLLKKAYLKIK